MKRILYQSAVLCLCLVLILPFLFSCTRADSDLIGRWETEIVDEELGKFSMVYHFTEEGEIFLEQKKGAEIPFSIPFGTFSVNQNKLVVQSDGKETSFTFSVSENELILSDEKKNEIVFHRADPKE